MVVVSKIMFAIHFIVVSILLYNRPPGRQLLRTSISTAAVIVIVTPNAALKDLRHTSSLANQERENSAGIL